MSIDVAEPDLHPAQPARRHRPRRARRRRPRLQRGDRPRAVGPAAATPTSPRSSPTATGSRSPTTPAPTPRPSIARALAGEIAVGHGRCTWRRRAAAGRCARCGRPRTRPCSPTCDVDLSTDLAALLPLVAPLISGHSDLAIGTRLGRGSRVVRGPKREFISRCYNLLLRGTLQTGFTDAQCGFKAIRADVARRLLPLVEDTGWFFDTELLVLAERAGLRIHEVPVDWVDDPDSRVDIVATALADLRGIWRVGRALGSGALPVAELRAQLGRAPLAPSVPGVPTAMPRQLVRFAAIGVASTVALPAAVPAVPRR